MAFSKIKIFLAIAIFAIFALSIVKNSSKLFNFQSDDIKFSKDQGKASWEVYDVVRDHFTPGADGGGQS